MKKRTQEYFDEGEATFWKNSRFALVKSETSSLATLANKVLIFKVNVKHGKSGKAFLTILKSSWLVDKLTHLKI